MAPSVPQVRKEDQVPWVHLVNEEILETKAHLAHLVMTAQLALLVKWGRKDLSESEARLVVQVPKEETVQKEILARKVMWDLKAPRVMMATRANQEN